MANEAEVVPAEPSTDTDGIEIVERPTHRESAAALARLSSVQRGLVGIGLGLFLILWPNLALDLIVAVAGLGLAGFSLINAWRAVRRRNGRAAARSCFDALIGLALFVASSLAVSVVAVALAVALAVRAVLDAVTAVRAYRAGGAAVWFAVRAMAQLVTAAAVVVLGDGAVLIVLLLVGITWVVGGAIAIALAVTAQADPTRTLTDELAPTTDPTSTVVVSWFRNQDVGEAARADIVDKLIFEGDDLKRRVARFASLMAFATAIATLGVQTDSTAVVIGAMLVAPLMTPIMATSLSFIMGSPTRAIRSLSLVATGVAIAVGLAFLIARYAPGVVEIGANSQISSRTAPTLLDLLIALAAGCAGGYAVCRPDVSDSLPGVAIAVALVPPLAVVGITLSAGEFALAGGAFLLFLTNLVGIIVASGVIFAATGVAPWTDIARNAAQLRQVSLTVLAALVLVSIPLAITGERILADATNQDTASSTTQTWLDEQLAASGETPGDQLGDGLPKLQIVQVNLDGQVVEIILIGDGELGEPRDLADRLATDLRQPVVVELRVIPETRVTVGSG